jgi:predicted Fe-Mo cluster-binding NifX family protein
MKVITPVVDNKTRKFEIADGMHNAEFFCVYHCEGNIYEWINIEDLGSKAGNLSIALKRKGIYTIICTHMPIIALGLFTESGLNVYRAESYNLVENINLYKNKLMKPFTTISALALEACSNSTCGSCKSPCN